MRFWITKNSELPVREQLVRQVLLGILSEDLPAGHKLPSVRAVARRHQIHSNTVSAAYHDLLEQGWLELRKGSGLYVRPLQPDGDGQLDRLLSALLQAARRQNYEPEEVLHRLEHMVHPVPYQRILIAETEPAMREILHAELTASLTVPIEFHSPDLEPPPRALVVALPTRAAKIRRQLPRGIPCITLRLRSVRASLEGQAKPLAGYGDLHCFALRRNSFLVASHADRRRPRSRFFVRSGRREPRLAESPGPGDAGGG